MSISLYENFVLKKHLDLERRSLIKFNFGHTSWTTLHVAAREGDLQMARVLIQNGANINAQDTRGWTPLHEACFWSQKELVKLLKESGADLRIMNKEGKTPQDLQNSAI